MSTESEKKGIEASFKSMDTEEFLDIYFNRPIGCLLYTSDAADD